MLYDDTTAGQTFELYGPKNYSTAEIAELVDREIFKKRKQVNIPKAILKPIAGLVNRVLWWNMMSADQVEREFHDQKIDELAKTFKDLDIEPAEISKFTYHYLVSARPDEVFLTVKLIPQCSKDSGALLSTTYHQRRRRRSGKRRSTCMFWMTSEKGVGVAELL